MADLKSQIEEALSKAENARVVLETVRAVRGDNYAKLISHGASIKAVLQAMSNPLDGMLVAKLTSPMLADLSEAYGVTLEELMATFEKDVDSLGL